MSYDPAAEAATVNEQVEPTTQRRRGAKKLEHAKTMAERPQNVLVECPVGHYRKGYAQSFFNFRVTRRQAAAAHLMWQSLQYDGHRFQGGRGSHPDGSPIESGCDGLRWLLDRLADAIEQDTKQDLTTDFGLEF